MPVVTLAQVDKYIGQFGKNTFSKFLTNLREEEETREASAKVIEQSLQKIKYPVLMQTLAISYCGVGECHETTNRALLELGLAGCVTQIYAILLQNKSADSLHAILVIGDCSKLKNNFHTLDSFRLLDDNCILLDPFLSVVGKANELKTLIGDYIKVYQLSSISSCDLANPVLRDYPGLQKEARSLAEQIKAYKAKNTINTPCANDVSKAFFSFIYPDRTHVISFYQGCKNIPKGQEIIDVFSENKPVSQAFRKACAYGAETIVKLLLNDRGLLGNFDLNEPSGNGLTALDWVNKNKIPDKTKAEIKRVIIEAGALTAEEIKLNISTSTAEPCQAGYGR